MDEFLLNCIEKDGALMGVEVKVPKRLADSPQVAVNLVNDQKQGRMAAHPVEFVRFDDSYWFVPVDTGGFEKSLPNEPILRRPLSLDERFVLARKLTEAAAREGR